MIFADLLEHFDEYLTGEGKLQQGQQVSRDWLVFSSGNISSDVRRLHIEEYVLELPAAFNALSELAEAALNSASITPVSDDPEDRDK